jgi:hypothetical protein
MIYGQSGNLPTRSILCRPVLASTAINGGRFVGYNGAEIATAGADAYGVAESDGEIGEYVTVTVLGEAQVISAAAITVGAAISASANGRAQVATAGQRILGKALTATTAADQKLVIILEKAGVA